MENKNTFHIGVCMAGAVSAGAYTAGVMDYLLEALDNWERAKDLQKKGKLADIPTHNFLIEVLSGASAGGMTAAITAAAVQCQFPHITQTDAKDEEKKKKNPLYNSWVNLTEEEGKDMMEFMLCTDDIESDKENTSREVRAGFNSSFIPQVASSIIDRAVRDADCRRPYVADDVDIFTTITNLRGFKYNVKFKTSQGEREHRMKMHRDYAFFQLNKDDSYKGNGRIPLHFNDEKGFNKDTLKQAAMATGAFPVGLEPRELIRERQYILDNRYLNLTLNGVEAANVNFLPEDSRFISLNVDGGVINNEPFETTEQILEDRRLSELLQKYDDELSKQNLPEAEFKHLVEQKKKELSPQVELKTSASQFDSMVLMVDPFPSEDEDLSTFVVKKAWKNVLPSIIGAMRGQLMMKDEQVKKAYLSDDYTRFLISPVRTQNGQTQKYSIACGSFQGFGGFFSKRFREHDFYLGRRNCQRFLQRFLSVPINAGNPILENGYNGFKSKYSFMDQGVEYLPIVPDIRVVEDKATGKVVVITPPEEKEYTYPQVNLSYLLGLQDKFEKRVRCIMDNVSNTIPATGNTSAPKDPGLEQLMSKIRKKSFFGRLFNKVVISNALNAYMWAGKQFGKGPAAEMFIDAVIGDMYKRGLLKDDYKR